MAITADLIGRVFPPSSPKVLTAEALTSFARAVGYTDGPCVDATAAVAQGFRSVVAAPTFAIVLTLEGAAQLSQDPEIGLDFSHVVHGDQRFEYNAALVAGDEVVVTTTVEDVKSLAGNTIVTVRGDITDTAGHAICTGWTTLVVRAIGSGS